MIESEAALHDFLHHAHIFTATVREILEEKYLQETTDLGITPPQLNLLRLINHKGDHQIREIASFLGVSQPAASKTVDKLVRLGLVKRQTHEDDRRAVSLSLTLRGKNTIQNYEILKAEKLKEAFKNITPEELHTLTRGLEKISYQILECEDGVWDICMKCSAYYVEHCPLRELHIGCIYVQNRKELTH